MTGTTTGLVLAVATISVGAGGCSGCDKGSGSAADGGATTSATADASLSTKPVVRAPEDDAGANDRCVETEAAAVVDKSIRLDAGIALVRLVDGRIAVGWATGEGTPKAAIVDATGKLTPLEVDASGIPELATKPAAKTLRSILRVTPFAPEGAAPRARVAIDLLEVAPDKTRWLRCGAADRKPLFEFKGKSAYDGAADGVAAAEIRECRTYIDGDREWAMASELRPTEAADGYEARWLVGSRASDPSGSTTLMPPIETRKIEAQKDKTPPRADRHVFEVPVASATPNGFVVASRYNGQIVIGRLNPSLAPEGKAVGHWLGVPTGTPALATRIDPGGAEAWTSLIAAALGKTDLYEANFPSAPGKPAPAPTALVITEPEKKAPEDASGVDRTAISATTTNHGSLVVGYALGASAKKRARLAIVRSPGSGPLGPPIEIAENDHVPELRVAALSDGHVFVAWAAQKTGGLALTTAIYRCGPVDPVATVLAGDVPGDGGPPADRD
jgi:hypothetical protein